MSNNYLTEAKNLFYKLKFSANLASLLNGVANSETRSIEVVETALILVKFDKGGKIAKREQKSEKRYGKLKSML